MVGPDVAARVQSWLSPSDGRTMVFWDDGGPVAMAGLSGPTPTGIRIGPVYTPPERRRRGYAGNLVAGIAAAAPLGRGEGGMPVGVGPERPAIATGPSSSQRTRVRSSDG